MDVVLCKQLPPFFFPILLNRKLTQLCCLLDKRLSALLQQVDKMDEVKITVLTGKGDFFSVRWAKCLIRLRSQEIWLTVYWI